MGPVVPLQHREGRSHVDHLHHRGAARADVELPARFDHADDRRGERRRSSSSITDCFDNVKDHDFAGATTCAAGVLANTERCGSNLTLNLTTIQQQYRVIMAGRPKLVVAVTGYPNPYPEGARRGAEDRGALHAAHRHHPDLHRALGAAAAGPRGASTRSFKKLNKTIEDAVKPFAIGSGGRFVYVDTYTKTARPLHEDGSRDQDEGRAPRRGRGRARSRLAQGELRLLRSVVQGGGRRDGDAELPRSGDASAS